MIWGDDKRRLAVGLRGLILQGKKPHSEILVYKVNAAPFFQNDTNYFTRPVSNDPTRKQFFAKLLGAAAAVSVAPKLLASSGQPLAPLATSALPVIVRSEVRAVARRAGAV